MTTTGRSLSQAQPVPRATPHPNDYPAGGLGFDWAVVLLTLWFTIGLYVDGWAHNHGFTDETFFTPWHALLYSGMAATGLFLAVQQLRFSGRGYAWAHSLPKGYLLSLVGVVVFFLSGGFDFLWHEVFGFEANLEALLSPAHLLLASSGALIITGPLRAAWARPGHITGWRRLGPVVVSLLILLSLLTFFSQYANLFAQGGMLAGLRQGFYWDATNISHFVVTALVTTFVLLLALRRWTLPFGAVTLILSANAALMFALRFEAQRDYVLTLLAAPLTGLLADGSIRWLRPSVARPWALRFFAFIVPFTLAGLVMVVLLLTERIGWRVHMWLGATFTAGIVGLMQGFLLAPPAFEAETP